MHLYIYFTLGSNQWMTSPSMKLSSSIRHFSHSPIVFSSQLDRRVDGLERQLIEARVAAEGARAEAAALRESLATSYGRAEAHITEVGHDLLGQSKLFSSNVMRYGRNLRVPHALHVSFPSKFNLLCRLGRALFPPSPAPSASSAPTWSSLPAGSRPRPRPRRSARSRPRRRGTRRGRPWRRSRTPWSTLRPSLTTSSCSLFR